MSDIVLKFGRYIENKIAKNPDQARKELLLGYRIFNLKMKYAADKRLPDSRKYLSQICMDAHIRSFAHADNSVLVSVFLPCEILQSMGLGTIFAEGFSGYITGAYAEKALAETAEGEGIAETYCSYHKVLMGAAFSGMLPKPKLIINTSIICDANNLTFRALSDFYGVPRFYVDVPTTADETSVQYVAEQLREMVEFITRETGLKLDENKLKAAVARSRDSINNFKKAMEYKRTKYINDDVTSEMYEVFVTHPMLGTEETLKYSQMLIEDYKKAEEKKGLRILWMHVIPYFQEPVRETFNFNEKCQILTCDMNFEGLVDMDPEKPYESMARRMVMSSFNGSANRRIEKALETAKALEADGIVYFCHWGCKQTMGAAVGAKKVLEANGFPTLILNGDGSDRRNTSDGQVRTRLDAFIEMLEEMKK